jgi:hypothetical protein
VKNLLNDFLISGSDTVCTDFISFLTAFNVFFDTGLHQTAAQYELCQVGNILSHSGISVTITVHSLSALSSLLIAFDFDGVEIVMFHIFLFSTISFTSSAVISLHNSDFIGILSSNICLISHSSAANQFL